MDLGFVLVNFENNNKFMDCNVHEFLNYFCFIYIGKRFAELEMKLALVEILSKFEVMPCEKTEIPITFSKSAFIVLPKNGIWLKFKQISS